MIRFFNPMYFQALLAFVKLYTNIDIPFKAEHPERVQTTANMPASGRHVCIVTTGPPLRSCKVVSATHQVARKRRRRRGRRRRRRSRRWRRRKRTSGRYVGISTTVRVVIFGCY